MSKFTYVEHPVGYHIDTFRDRKAILENKVCLMEPPEFESAGRGGGGCSKFVWALLDWQQVATKINESALVNFRCVFKQFLVLKFI